MKVAIIKYNAGNVTSVINALERQGVKPVLTDDPEYIMSADKVIFPGQGEASSGIAHLRAKGLDKVIVDLKQPFLGVCLGLQLLCKHSEEGNVDLLGLFDVNVRKFPPLDKVPHVGWNNVTDLKSELFEGLHNPYLYYVHSYYAEPSADTAGTTTYIKPFSAVLQKDNFYAIQAHPEKSGKEGERILSNFLNL